jgi:hypothetical protein
MPELTVVLQDEQVVRAETPTGGEIFGRLKLDALEQRVVRLFDEWLRTRRVRERAELELFGAVLYRALFGGEVGICFDRLLDDATTDERLRVQLRFDEPAGRLARLPWEFLYRPRSQTRRGLFLATERELVLTRFMPLETARAVSLRPTDAPLRILVAIATPRDLPRVITGPVIRQVQRFAAGSPRTEMTVLAEATLERLLEQVGVEAPHILHFMGHGEFDEGTRRARVALLGADGNADWIPDSTFVDALARAASLPRMVLLHACQGATVDFASDHRGLAPELVRTGVQAVVAMQYPVTNRAAMAFSQALYQELTRGAPVDHAVQDSRWSLAHVATGRFELRDFGTPVLYLRSRDGIISPGRAHTAGDTEI